MNEVQVSEAERPDSGLANAQAELAQLNRKIGWIDCLSWLVKVGYLEPWQAALARNEADEVLKGGGVRA